MSKIATVILAAGHGTRMKSSKAKVLHEVGGQPMVLRAIQTAAQLSSEQPTLVIGRDADTVRQLVGNQAQFVEQGELLGTGHAVMQTVEVLRGQCDMVVVYYADMPLLRAQTLQKVIDAQQSNAGPVSLLTVIEDDPRGFGRIVRAENGGVIDIVEEHECTPEQRQIRELNVGVFAFDAAWLWDNLSKLKVRSKGEYYLTDTVPLAASQGLQVIGVQLDDKDELIGVNTRIHLSEAEAALRRRVNKQLMLQGVTMLDPASTYIHEGVQIGNDTVILPNTYLYGQTVIGSRCIIGPHSYVIDSSIGDDCEVEASFVEKSTLENHVNVGPFAHLRAKSYLCEGVHMGNFGEVKNSRLGPHTRMGHFSYIGDAQLGEDVNVGAGTITCNFDGINKHQTVVGDHAFIGSDTMLVAPVNIGTHGRTAAGAVVTKNVPDGYIGIGVPARMRPIHKPDEQLADHQDS